MVLVVAIGVLAVGGVQPLRRGLEREVAAHLQAATDAASAQVHHYLNARCDEVRMWASMAIGSPGHRDGGATDGVAALLGRLREGAGQTWSELLLVDDTGRVVASSGRPAAGGFVHPSIPAADREAGMIEGCSLVLATGERPALLLSHPLPAFNGQRRRLVGVSSWRAVEDLIKAASLATEERGPAAIALLLDDRNQVLAGDREGLDRNPGAEAALAREEGRGTTRERFSEEHEYLVARTGLSTAWPGAPPIRLAALIDRRAALDISGGPRNLALQVALVGLALVLSLSYLLVRGLTARLNRLIAVSRRLPAGQRQVRLSDGHEDEIGTLERAFDEMAVSVERTRSELEAAVSSGTRELESRSAALDAAIRQSRSTDSARAEFLANVSHEIRTPLNGIIGMTALALDADLSSEARGHLSLVKTSADALLDLVNDLLDFSKIEGQRLSLQPMTFRLRPGLEDTLTALAERAALKGLRLTHSIDEAVPDDLIGDPGRLRQILVSLVGNAIKFTERGGIDVGVSLAEEAGPLLTLQFSVRDTGIGIAKEKQALIFEPFTQVDGSSTRRHGGIGLGLAIASQLVDLMRGRLWVESRPGDGSCFHFTASFERAPAAAATASAAAPAGLQGVRILVVDDNPINRRLLEARLKAWGMRPDVAEDGRQALGALSRAAHSGAPYPLALLDVQMPGLDGFSVAAEVKGHPQLASTRLLLLTSAGQRGDATRCREIGLEAYLTKPAREAELRDALLSILTTPAAAAGHASLVTRHALREKSRPSGILVPESSTSVPDTTSGLSDLPILDPLDLLARVDGDRTLLSELVRAFMSTAPQQLAAIDAALSQGEGTALSRAAHTLKGSVGTFAALRALRAADRVESLGLMGDLRSAGAARQELGTEIERLSQALMPYLSGS